MEPPAHVLETRRTLRYNWLIKSSTRVTKSMWAVCLFYRFYLPANYVHSAVFRSLRQESLTFQLTPPSADPGQAFVENERIRAMMTSMLDYFTDISDHEAIFAHDGAQAQLAHLISLMIEQTQRHHQRLNSTNFVSRRFLYRDPEL